MSVINAIGNLLESNAVMLLNSDKVLGRQSSGPGAAEEIDCTSAGRAMIAAADADAQLTLLGAITASSTDTLTNKTISGADNTLSNIDGSSLVDDSVNISKLAGELYAMGINLIIPAVSNINYSFTLYAGCNGYFFGIAERADSLVTAGTFSIKLNGVDVAGLSNIVPTTAGSYTNVTGSPTFNRGDKIEISYSGTAGIVNHALTLDIDQIV